MFDAGQIYTNINILNIPKLELRLNYTHKITTHQEQKSLRRGYDLATT